MPADPWLVLAAAGLEGLVGYPAWLHRAVPHPVVGVGAALAWFERRLNHGGDLARRSSGIITLAAVAAAASALG